MLDAVDGHGQTETFRTNRLPLGGELCREDYDYLGHAKGKKIGVHYFHYQLISYTDKHMCNALGTAGCSFHCTENPA